MVADGIDPFVEKQRRKLRAQITFKGVAEEWFVKITREERAEVTLSKVRWLLEKVYPFLPLHQIEVQEVLAVLRRIEATGRYESRAAHAQRNYPRLTLRHRHRTSEG